MAKTQRIRDPLHDLIEFGIDDFDQFLWKLINTPEFQRLRRVKQLGFSELVYPGATHSRFSHSIGVFHTARQLISLISNRIEKFDRDAAEVALTAALVHDLGHGPFSHAFEEATKLLNKDISEREGKKAEKLKKHEIWTSEIILGDTAISQLIRDEKGEDFQKRVSNMLLADTPADIYSAVVSSQFDADRLDYVRRDRLMTGAKHGGFDYSWILANLQVAPIPLAIDDEAYSTVDSLVLGPKAFQAAESYVLGLFHLYFTVYYHKATRSAEKILSAVLRRLGNLIASGDAEKSGLGKSNPLISFIEGRALQSYVNLDDFLVWGSLTAMQDSEDIELSTLSRRLLRRDLYKAVDITNHFEGRGENSGTAHFRAALSEAKKNGDFDETEIFEDQPSRNPYKRRGHGSPEALSKIYIKMTDEGRPEDLRDCSDVVKALEEKTVFRVYVRDAAARKKIEDIIKKVEK
ncbi:HD domain-containing protein [Rhizobium sp. 1AS11]|uniref:HD domain-containing protein n=1 Tax=Rhizobium acaciae TaxID=2989736 RepID=UPI00221E6411|nr:HD domain-containing protein [Rhizobium acaciae]MCW1407331.1 HD domain-containing protein [Rhizobium acaciae]MCW1738844.1 HD domain-containing protein [Rhizobium acaciae]MCW1748125.1 HD domain-containing protein [Rhizobium acaciae]